MAEGCPGHQQLPQTSNDHPTDPCCLDHWPHCPGRWAGSGWDLRVALVQDGAWFRLGPLAAGEMQRVCAGSLPSELSLLPLPPSQGHVLEMELLSALLLGF